MNDVPAADQPKPDKADIEAQKLAFEKEKHSLEETWKRRTFAWSIVSTILGSAVSVGVTLAGKNGAEAPSAPSVAAVQGCRNSLQRLPTLASLSGQTVAGLAHAIKLHEADCDRVLSDLALYLAKAGR